MNRSSDHFLAAVCGLTLLGSIGLAASRPARSISAGGPVPVQVVNSTATPALTRDVDNGDRQPFQQPFTMNFGRGDTEILDNPVLSVPAGKRLVIETISVSRGFSARGTLNPTISNRLNGISINFALPPVAANGANNPGIMQPTRLYADGNQAVIIRADRSDATFPESDLVSISGYLVNLS